MAYEPKGYTDKDAIEDYMLITIEDSFDPKIDEWICAAEELIDAATNRDFTPGSDDDDPADRLYDGDGTSILNIDPALEVMSVKLSPTGTAIDTTQYVQYPANKPLKRKLQLRYLRFPCGLQNIVVNAKWGGGQVPADIKHAATVIVAGIINFAWGENEVQSMTIGRYTVSYITPQQADDFANVKEILAAKKRYTF